MPHPTASATGLMLLTGPDRNRLSELGGKICVASPEKPSIPLSPANSSAWHSSRAHGPPSALVTSCSASRDSSWEECVCVSSRDCPLLPGKESPSLLVPSVASLRPPPPPCRPCHLGRGRQGPPSLHLTTWVQGERRRKPPGLHFLKSSFVSDKAKTLRPGSLSPLTETQRQEECGFHSDLSSRLGAPDTVSSL